MFKYLKTLFRRHKHNWIVVYSKELDDTFNWQENILADPGTAFSPSIYKTEHHSYKGRAFLNYFICSDCHEQIVELVYPEGKIPYSDVYLSHLIESDLKSSGRQNLTELIKQTLLENNSNGN